MLALWEIYTLYWAIILRRWLAVKCLQIHHTFYYEFNHFFVRVSSTSSINFGLGFTTNKTYFYNHWSFSYFSYAVFEFRVGHRPVSVGIRAQNPKPNQPTVETLPTVPIRFESSVTAVSVWRVRRFDRWLVSGLGVKNRYKNLTDPES